MIHVCFYVKKIMPKSALAFQICSFIHSFIHKALIERHSVPGDGTDEERLSEVNRKLYHNVKSAMMS